MPDWTIKKSQLKIGLENHRWLSEARDKWDELVSLSNANPLFLGWIWQYHWWVHFENQDSREVRIVTVTNETGDLVGIAPFFARKSAIKLLRRATQLAPIGNGWRMSTGEVTEHTDWIVRRGWESTVPAAIGQYIAEQLDWDELLFSYTAIDSIARMELFKQAEKNNWYIRQERPLEHFSIDTSVSFERYVESLGRNTRLRLMNRRKLLSSLGEVAIRTTDYRNIESQLEKLERLSAQRWENRFPPPVRRFYVNLANEWLKIGALRLSTLEVDDRAISAILDVEFDGVIYNIRSAIDTTFSTRISPGLLHFGYAIENACNSTSVSKYAMLAGPGKQTDYKIHLATERGSFSSFQLIRRGHEKRLYKFYDWLKHLSQFGYKH